MTGFTWFDLTVGGLMLVSGLLALMRGFTREITSLVAWGAAGAAALVAAFTPDLVAQAKVYISEEWLAQAAVGGGVFLIVLIILSLISIRFTDWLLDSSPGAFDRTLGFFYGLARGLLLIVILYSFYIFFLPQKSHFQGLREARSLMTVESVALKLYEFFPAKFTEQAKILSEKTYTYSRQNPATQNNAPADTPSSNGSAKTNSYKAGDKKVLDQLIENTQRSPDTSGQN
jgi:membrane protein required for colicin V production